MLTSDVTTVVSIDFDYRNITNAHHLHVKYYTILQ